MRFHRSILTALAATSVLGVLIAYHRWAVSLGGWMGWDQAHHFYWGNIIYGDLLRGDWLTAVFDSYRQVYWPFLQSWVLAGCFFVFGHGYVAGQLSSLIPYILTGCILSVLAWKLVHPRTLVSPLVTVLLWWSSARFVTEFAIGTYAESLAIFLTSLSLLAAIYAREKQTVTSYYLAGLSSMLVYFSKTDYGLLVILTTAAGIVLTEPHKRKYEALFRYSLPIACISMLWFAYPPKIAATLDALFNRPQGPSRWSWEGITYHPAMLAFWCDSTAVFLAGLFCIGYVALKYRRDSSLFLLLYLAIALLLHTFSQTKDQKHIVKLLPWFYVFIGLGIGSLYMGMRARPLLRFMFLTVILAAAGLRLSSSVSILRQHRPPALDSSARLIAARINPARSALVAGAFAELSPFYVKNLVLQRRPLARILPDPVYSRFRQSKAGQILVQGDTPVLHIDHVDPRNPDLPAHTSQTIQKVLRGSPEEVFVIELRPESKWRTEDYSAFVTPGDEIASILDESSEYERVDQVPIPPLQGNLAIYRRRSLVRDDLNHSEVVGRTVNQTRAEVLE